MNAIGNAIVNVFRAEPTVAITAVGTFIDAVIVLLVTFGLAITPAEAHAVDGAVVAGGLLITMFTIRSQVTPVATVTAAALATTDSVVIPNA